MIDIDKIFAKFSSLSGLIDSVGRMTKTVEYLLVALLVFISFAVSLLAFFPTEVIEPRLEREVGRHLGMEIDIEQIGFGFPFTLTCERLIIELPIAGAQSVELSEISIEPNLLSLLSTPYGAISGNLSGGSFKAELSADQQLELFLDRVAIGSLVPPNPWTELNGELSATLSLKQAEEGLEGEFSIDGNALSLLGLEKIGLQDQHLLGNVTIKGGVKGEKIRVNEIASSGGEVALKGQASLSMATPPVRSRIGGQLSLRPTDKMAASTREMITLLGRKADREGYYTLRLGGTLASPVVR